MPFTLLKVSLRKMLTLTYPIVPLQDFAKTLKCIMKVSGRWLSQQWYREFAKLALVFVSFSPSPCWLSMAVSWWWENQISQQAADSCAGSVLLPRRQLGLRWQLLRGLVWVLRAKLPSKPRGVAEKWALNSIWRETTGETTTQLDVTLFVPIWDFPPFEKANDWWNKNSG